MANAILGDKMLDRLQNPSLIPSLNTMLMDVKTPNFQAITPNAIQKIHQENMELCALLCAKIARPFSFSVESFYFLLQHLSKHYTIALALSSHNLLYQAYLLMENTANIIPLLPSYETGKITQESIELAYKQGADCFIIPAINEDILTENILDSLPSDALKIIDISYPLALNLPLENLLRIYDIALINGENLGIMRPFGVLASKKDNFFGLPSIYLEIQNLYITFTQALHLRKEMAQNSYLRNLAQEFFYILEATLKDSCYCFYKTPPNTLALGLKGIKARNLIQSLLFDKIALINGQECLFGFTQPSFVLRLMGYSEMQSRELISLSFLEITPSLIPQFAKKIAEKYLQVRTLQ